MGRPNNVTVAKAAMDSTLVATAGAMNDQQFDDFIALVREQPTLLRDIDFQRMDALKTKLESLEFGGRISFRAQEGVAATSDQRGSLVASKVELDAQEIQCEISITDRLRKKILLRGNSLDDYAIARMGEQFALDQEDLVVNGVYNGSSYTLLDTLDGMIEQIPSGNLIDYTSNLQTVTDNPFYEAFLAIAAKYRRTKQDMRIYCASDVQAAFNKWVSSRQTAGGDIRLIDGTSQTFWNGILFYEVPTIPDGSFFMTSRHNVVWGLVDNEVRPYKDEQPSAAVTLYGLRCYIDVKFREADAVVYYKGLDASASITTV